MRNLNPHSVELVKGRKDLNCRPYGVPDPVVELKDFPLGEVRGPGRVFDPLPLLPPHGTAVDQA